MNTFSEYLPYISIAYIFIALVLNSFYEFSTNDKFLQFIMSVFWLPIFFANVYMYLWQLDFRDVVIAVAIVASISIPINYMYYNHMTHKIELRKIAEIKRMCDKNKFLHLGDSGYICKKKRTLPKIPTK